MVAQQAVRHLGVGGNIAQAHARESTRGKNRARAGDDALARLLGNIVALSAAAPVWAGLHWHIFLTQGPVNVRMGTISIYRLHRLRRL